MRYNGSRFTVPVRHIPLGQVSARSIGRHQALDGLAAITQCSWHLQVRIFGW